MSLKNKTSDSEKMSQAIATHGLFNTPSQEERDLRRLDAILERQHTLVHKKSAEEIKSTFD
jgi:hypothetical protein